MISVGSCDTDDLSNDAEISALHLQRLSTTEFVHDCD